MSFARSVEMEIEDEYRKYPALYTCLMYTDASGTGSVLDIVIQLSSQYSHPVYCQKLNLSISYEFNSRKPPNVPFITRISLESGHVEFNIKYQ